MSVEKPDCVLDVLTKSILMHPSLFAEACENEAREDRRYVTARPDMNQRAKEGAIARAEALEFAADAARKYSSAACAAMAIVDRRAASWVAAFNVAGRLLCYSRATLTDLAAKESAQ